MTENKIRSIYNNLFKWEGNTASQPYPIHKKLNTDTFQFTDIYEWISNTYDINERTRVLDAGCGVGYGALYLSEKHNCRVDGISLSNEEIKIANKFASEKDQKDLIKFEERSFDNLNPKSYDLIIAIESVKHSLNINKTKTSLISALKPNGILVIIDDLINKNIEDKITIKYVKDWALKIVLHQGHFAPEFKIKKDLTPFVKTKTNLEIFLGIVLFSILKPFITIAPIIRGGLYLEKLFKDQKMSYCALEFKK